MEKLKPQASQHDMTLKPDPTEMNDMKKLCMDAEMSTSTAPPPTTGRFEAPSPNIKRIHNNDTHHPSPTIWVLFIQKWSSTLP